VEATRALLLVGISLGLVLGTVLARAWAARRARAVRATSTAELWARLGATSDGRPTVVAFSSPSCAACHTAQRPALRALASTHDVRTIEIDVASQPDVARAFGILSVPATVLLSDAGVLRINHGFRSAQALAQQLAEAPAVPVAAAA
jgi:thioredoxin-like negative regulator of GroEL